MQARGDFAIGQAAGDVVEQRSFASREADEPAGDRVGVARLVAGGKLVELPGKRPPRRLVGAQDVIAAVEGNEAGARNRRGELPACLERHQRVAAHVKYERRRGDLRGARANVERIERVPRTAGPRAAAGCGAWVHAAARGFIEAHAWRSGDLAPGAGGAG